MAGQPLLRRAMLYIPASSQKMLDKSRQLAVDCGVFDLEDSVAPHMKDEARRGVCRFLAAARPGGMGEVAVRINSVDSGRALDDLAAVMRIPGLDALVVPKVQSAADLHFVADAARHLLPGPGEGAGPAGPRIIALIESAKGLVNLHEICRATPRLSGLVFAAEDFCLDLSITRTPSLSELLFARSSIVTAARAHNLASAIDLVCTQFRGGEGRQRLAEECEDGRRMGFTGKQLIHPSQVDAAQRAFSPSDAEVEWAVRIVTADRRASRMGKGAWTLDGKMIDAPVVRRAEALVAKAQACRVDVETAREEWRDQEPE